MVVEEKNKGDRQTRKWRGKEKEFYLGYNKEENRVSKYIQLVRRRKTRPFLQEKTLLLHHP